MAGQFHEQRIGFPLLVVFQDMAKRMRSIEQRKAARTPRLGIGCRRGCGAGQASALLVEQQSQAVVFGQVYLHAPARRRYGGQCREQHRLLAREMVAQSHREHVEARQRRGEVAGDQAIEMGSEQGLQRLVFLVEVLQAGCKMREFGRWPIGSIHLPERGRTSPDPP